LQPGHRLAYHVATHSEVLGQLRLAGNSFTGLEAAFGDFHFQIPGNFHRELAASHRSRVFHGLYPVVDFHSDLAYTRPRWPHVTSLAAVLSMPDSRRHRRAPLDSTQDSGF